MNQPLINYIFNHWIARLQICPLYIFRKQIRQQMVAIKIHFFGNSRVCPLRLPVDESRRRPRWTTMKSDRWTWNLAEAWLMMGSRHPEVKAASHPRWRPNFRILGIKKVSCSFVEGDRQFQKKTLAEHEAMKSTWFFNNSFWGVLGEHELIFETYTISNSIDTFIFLRVHWEEKTRNRRRKLGDNQCPGVIPRDLSGYG